MLAKVCSAAISGIEAYPVEVNAGYGDTVLLIVGLPDAVGVQTVRPDVSRNTVQLPSMVALPVVPPLLPRKVVPVPTLLATSARSTLDLPG